MNINHRRGNFLSLKIKSNPILHFQSNNPKFKQTNQFFLSLKINGFSKQIFESNKNERIIQIKLYKIWQHFRRKPENLFT